MVGLQGREDGAGTVINWSAGMEQSNHRQRLLCEHLLVDRSAATQLDILGVCLGDVGDHRMRFVPELRQDPSRACKSGGAPTCEQDQAAGEGRHDRPSIPQPIGDDW